MRRDAADTPNPLTRLARSLPTGSGHTLALAGRLAGVAVAVAIVAQQGYDRTRVLAACLAAFTLVSCVPVLGWLKPRLPWTGVGVLFFGGALLASLDLGKALLLLGALAAGGIAIDEQQHGRTTAIPAFFAGLGLVSATVAAIVLLVAG